MSKKEASFAYDNIFTQNDIITNAKNVLSKRSIINDSSDVDKIKDSSWVRHGFFSTGYIDKNGNKVSTLSTTNRDRRFKSTALFKHTDSSPGGNLYINPLPQYTRYCDPREPGRLIHRNRVSIEDTAGNYGQGEYYSEAVDDNAQVVYMRFGVPEFNSLWGFFTSFYDPPTGTIARKGRAGRSFFVGEKLGKVLGYAVQLVYWPLLAAHAAGHVMQFLFNRQPSKFYRLKPSMMMYWTTVHTLLQTISVNKGIIPSYNSKVNANSETDTLENSFTVDADMRKNLAVLLPDLFHESGYIDIYNYVGKAARRQYALDNTLRDAYGNSSTTGTILNVLSKIGNTLIPGVGAIAGGIEIAFEKWVRSETVNPDEGNNYNRSGNLNSEQSANQQAQAEATGDDTRTRNTATDTINDAEPMFNINPSGNKNKQAKAKFPNQWKSWLDAEFNDGTAFVGFKVDYSGSAQESFSNAFGESELAQKINSISSASREFNFNTADGNITGGVLDSIVSFTKGLVSGAAESFQMSGLIALSGNAFVDIPKHWQSSSSSFNKTTYNITLSSPYGNTYSQMINIYIPLCCLLAAALPIQTGKQSYTSPMLLEYFDKGRGQTRLGMIDSLSVNRGTGNLGFNKKGQAMQVEVSFSIADMSSVMYTPINTGFFLNKTDGIFDEESVIGEYLAVMCGLNVREQVYRFPQLKRKLAIAVANRKRITSPGYWSMWLHEETPVGLLDALYTGVDF